MKWTEAEDRKLASLYRVLTIEETAACLGRSVYSVKNRASRLGALREKNITYRGGPKPTCLCRRCRICKARVRRKRWRDKQRCR